MSAFTSLTGQLLVSMPGMQGDYFSGTVTLLVEHNRQGAFGLVINRPLTASLAELLSGHQIECPDSIPLIETGPVEQNRLFFIHSDEVTFDQSVAVCPGVALTSSLDLVTAVAEGNGPSGVLAGLGYAGWSGGQLENEILADVWLVTPSDNEVIFNTPYEERPVAAAALIGVDLNLISPTPGHG